MRRRSAFHADVLPRLWDSWLLDSHGAVGAVNKAAGWPAGAFRVKRDAAERAGGVALPFVHGPVGVGVLLDARERAFLEELRALHLAITPGRNFHFRELTVGSLI